METTIIQTKDNIKISSRTKEIEITKDEIKKRELK